ncbi:MAG: response regulator transcription factor [Candidatus Limnocylindrales bacterium]
MAHPTSPDRPVRVLVVGSDRRLRSGLAGLLLLDPSIELAGVAIDVASALDDCHVAQPDVVLVDPHLPDVPDGLALVAAVRRLLPATRIVNVCVAEDDDPDSAFDVRLHCFDDPGLIVDIVADRVPRDAPLTSALDRSADAAGLGASER